VLCCHRTRAHRRHSVMLTLRGVTYSKCDSVALSLSQPPQSPVLSTVRLPVSQTRARNRWVTQRVSHTDCRMTVERTNEATHSPSRPPTALGLTPATCSAICAKSEGDPRGEFHVRSRTLGWRFELTFWSHVEADEDPDPHRPINRTESGPGRLIARRSPHSTSTTTIPL